MAQTCYVEKYKALHPILELHRGLGQRRLHTGAVVPAYMRCLNHCCPLLDKGA